MSNFTFHLLPSNTIKIIRFLTITVLLVGILFRLTNIDKKVYWSDETATLLRISGYSRSEAVEQIFNGQIITAQEIQYKYQSPVPQKNLRDAITNLSADIHPPLYFILSRWWFQLFQPWFTSSTIIRGFSVLSSLLTFPALYWLCIELFNSSWVATMTLMIFSVSPIQVLYAQEARMYSLWTLLIVLSSASLLRAIRVNKISAWFLYSLLLAASFYTYLFSILVAIGQGVYVLTVQKLKLTKALVSYVIFSGLAGLFFVPWIFFLYLNLEKFSSGSSWVEATKTDIVFLIKVASNNIFNSLSDFWFIYTFFPNLSIPDLRFGMFIKPVLLVLIVYSIYFLCRSTPSKVWLFVLTLTGITPLILLIRDITAQSGILTQARYLLPCYLGIQLSLAYLLAQKSIDSQASRFWRFVTLFILSIGILSITVSSQADIWLNKYYSNEKQVATIINQYSNAAVITDGSLGSILSLSHHVKPNTSFLIIKNSEQLDLEKLDNRDNIFLFQVSSGLRNFFQTSSHYHLIRLPETRGLWKAESQK